MKNVILVAFVVVFGMAVGSKTVAQPPITSQSLVGVWKGSTATLNFKADGTYFQDNDSPTDKYAIGLYMGTPILIIYDLSSPQNFREYAIALSEDGKMLFWGVGTNRKYLYRKIQ